MIHSSGRTVAEHNGLRRSGDGVLRRSGACVTQVDQNTSLVQFFDQFIASRREGQIAAAVVAVQRSTRVNVPVMMRKLKYPQSL